MCHGKSVNVWVGDATRKLGLIVDDTACRVLKLCWRMPINVLVMVFRVRI